MSFFDSIPKPPPREPDEIRRQPSWMPSETVIPGSVQADLLLVRTDQVAVAVGSLRAYPNGFVFTVHTLLRRVDRELGSSGDPFSWDHRFGGAHSRDDVLRLGVLYADGRHIATISPYGPLDDSPDDELVLSYQGGGGSARGWHQDFWVHPLPPEGPVTMTVSWLEHDVTEARGEVDGTAIRAAASRAISLWPDDPGVAPSSGWASQTIRWSKPDAKAGD